MVTGRGLDRGLGIFEGMQTPPIVITTTTGAKRMTGFPATVIDAGSETVELPRMIDALGDLGFDRVLCEGGPGLLGRLIAAGLLDELCLTTAPLILGAGPATMLADVRLPGPAGWNLVSLHLDGDQLFSRYRRAAD